METRKLIPELERDLGLTFDRERLLGGKRFRCAYLRSDPGEELLQRAIEVLGERCLDYADECTVLVGAEGDDPYAVYVGPKINPLELLAPFSVGTHNESLNEHEQTISTMTEIYQTVPFVAYFADAAGYRVRFLSDVTDVQAERFEEQLIELCPDAIELHEGEVAETIMRQRRLILWWD